MESSFLKVVGSIVTVALIATATRRLFTAAGSPLPRNQNGASVYAIKWQWRAVGVMGAIFWVVVSMW